MKDLTGTSDGAHHDRGHGGGRGRAHDDVRVRDDGRDGGDAHAPEL